MRIIFCNITYQRFYDGRTAGEVKPRTGGRWVLENEDAHEKWNFLNMDGICYGYVQGNSDQIHIEKLEKRHTKADSINDVTVVWCAADSKGQTVVVGWYEHAVAYRYCQQLFSTPVTGIDRGYWFKTKAEDAYLLPEEKRTMAIGRASTEGMGRGFGQQNYWFAQSAYAQNELIPQALRFMEENRSCRINILPEAFDEPAEPTPLSVEEEEYASGLSEDQNLEFLPYGYRIFANHPTADNAYNIASALTTLFQYRRAVPWYEKTIELDPTDIQTKGFLTYLYQQCGEFDKSIQTATELLKSEIADDADTRDEICSVLADNFFFKGDVDTAVSWLDRILKESRNGDLIEHTKKTKADWLQLEQPN